MKKSTVSTLNVVLEVYKTLLSFTRFYSYITFVKMIDTLSEKKRAGGIQ